MRQRNSSWVQKWGPVLTMSLAAAFFVSVPGYAQEESAAPEPPPAQAAPKATKADKDKKRTSIDFEDELIQGEVKKPELFYLLQKKQFNFKRLIKLREDFLPEMRRSAEDLRRGSKD